MNYDALLTKVSEHVHAGRSFGPVIERDGSTIVPVAVVISAGGGGGGEGPPDTDHAGSGSGAGHLSVSWPVGAYVVRGDDVRWRPAVDVTRIAIGALVLVRTIAKRRAARSSTG